MTRKRPTAATDPLAPLLPATRAWFTAAFAAPTPVQVRGFAEIAAGRHALLLAPTGSGKTLAAFLTALDRLARLPLDAAPGVRVLYVSPLKALAYDVERNLRLPLSGISLAAQRLGTPLRPIRVAIRTGDTPARERRAIAADPAEILITTPESLYLILTSQARSILRTVETVIVDEIHALAPTKRGAHLALSLERLVSLTAREPQRIGLSATQRPLDEIARYLAGEREVAIIDASEKPRLDLTIEVPVEDLEKPPPAPPRPGDDPLRAGEAPTEDRRGLWPHVHERILALVREHRSTIVFANSRRLCERLAQRLNEMDGGPTPLVRAHHGSIAREQREEIEELLKSGRLRGIVATSSLELGIDMGAVDLVVQAESPGAVSRGLQRVGRAGHGVGQRSTARIFPKYRGDLLETAVVGRRMLDGEVEPLRVPKLPLDVLAQQIVAMCAERPWSVAEIAELARRTYSFRTLSSDMLAALLDMLSGRYPSDEFADLRPRLVWDRNAGTIVARRDAHLLAIVNAGTIPDRGLYGVHLGEGGPRIGELDEEMVHESRAGQTFLLGASSWRIVEITRDRVIVQPAPGEPGRMPFWRGEGPGRPVELGRALGAFVRELGDKDEASACEWLARDYHLDERAAQNLVSYVREQKAATGALPTDRTIVIERFRDELGDFRVCILSPFGARVHAPWALALEHVLSTRAGFSVQTLWNDDGIVLRFADTGGELELPGAETLLPDPDDVEQLVIDELGRSALFATHFRENASRALLLPRRRPGSRTPLWAQRIRSQNLLAVAGRHADFPILLETYRECLHDVFDVPSLVELLGAARRREVRVVVADTDRPSPFARTLAFAYVAAWLYESDAPLAERKAQALTIDRDLLRELLGEEELRDLLDPAVLAEVEAELQGLSDERKARHVDGLHDLLRRVGDLSAGEIRARSAADPGPWIDALRAAGRIVALKVGRPAEERFVAVEDAAKYRDALGARLPRGIAAAHLEPQPAPLEALAARFARTHGPFVPAQPAARLGLAPGLVEPALRALVSSGRLLEGEFRPGGSGREQCDPEVLRVLRRRTLARLRNQVAPVEPEVLARFLGRWHGVGAGRSGLARLREVIDQLEGAALPFSELERAILPARVAGYQPRMLDELGAAGEVVWVGRGQTRVGDGDGRVALYRRDHVAALLDAPEAGPLAAPLDTPTHAALLEHLRTRGASFLSQLPSLVEGADEGAIEGALWDLVWAGHVTNDTFQPLRAKSVKSTPRRAPARPRRPSFARGAPRFETPAAVGGRWSAVSQLLAPARSDTERAHARAHMLLERYGVVSRAAAAAAVEWLPGGFHQIAPVLRALEESGRIRRGYFVEGLGGAQFAHGGAVERLRAARADDDGDPVTVLSAIDPANPWGALLPWPDREPIGADGDEDEGGARPRRIAGAQVVMVRGQPVLFIEKGGNKLRCFLAPVAGDDDTRLDEALAALRRVAAGRRHHELRIVEVNGTPVLRSRYCPLLERAGFRAQPGGLVLTAE